MAETIRVLGVCGSLREGSHTLEALKIALGAAKVEGAEIILFDLAQNPLPFCQGPSTDYQKANLERWQMLVQEADAMILGTPEYHGSYSGVLKNALDLVSIDQMQDKVCGLISVLGGGANSNALNHLRLVCRWVHAWVIPHQAAVGAAYSAFNEDGTLKDEKLHKRVERVGADVVHYTRLLRKHPELLGTENDSE